MTDTLNKNTLRIASLDGMVGGSIGDIDMNSTDASFKTKTEAQKSSSKPQNGIPSHKPQASSFTHSNSKDLCWSSGGVAECLLFEDTLYPVAEDSTSVDNMLDDGDKSSGLSFKEREHRVREFRERQQNERSQKLEELKEQAASAQKFRDQQELQRRLRLEEMRQKDTERRHQVEERRRLLEQSEQERREAILRKNVDKDQRLELKRRQERSNIVFAFGSSTPRMLDPKESVSTNLWSARRATSTTNVNVAAGATSDRAMSTSMVDSDLSRKRATSAHSLNRKPDESIMSSSMYEVFHWDGNETEASPTGTRLSKSRDSSVERAFRASVPRSIPINSNAQPFLSLQPSPLTNNPPMPASKSRFSVWEFDENFCALGPSDDSNYTKPSKCLPRSKCRHSDDETGSQHFITTSAARRRTDLLPTLRSLRDTTSRTSGTRTQVLTPLHENTRRHERMKPRVMSKSMSHLGPRLLQPTETDSMPDGMKAKKSSRSSHAVIQPRPTRAQVLRENKINATTNAKPKSSDSVSGTSGATTPGSPSRPTSALSQGSSGHQVPFRSKTSARRPRPLTIAGSILSAADKPKEVPTPPLRQGRPFERKASTESAPPLKHTRTKSAENQKSVTPSRTPRTSKRTPAQVKAESALKKEKAKTAARNMPTEAVPVNDIALSINGDATLKTTAVTMPSEELSADKAPTTEIIQSKESVVTEVTQIKKESVITSEVTADVVTTTTEVENIVNIVTNDIVTNQTAIENQMENVESISTKKNEVELIDANDNVPSTNANIDVSTTSVITDNPKTSDDSTEPVVPASEKPVTGYATEDEYKQALAEKRRQAREARERELELQRQKQLEQEEKERREEEEYLRLMEEQRKAEEERLQKAIEEAAKNKELEIKQKEEEEKLRIEMEEKEKIKQKEAEEKMKREEEARQARKSRVAQIMARTRGKGQLKAEGNDDSMSESFISDMSSSMTDSMIVEAIESRNTEKTTNDGESCEKTENIIQLEDTPIEKVGVSLEIQYPQNGSPTGHLDVQLQPENNAAIVNGKSGTNGQVEALVEFDSPKSDKDPLEVESKRLLTEEEMNSNNSAFPPENISNKHQDTANLSDALL